MPRTRHACPSGLILLVPVEYSCLSPGLVLLVLTGWVNLWLSPLYSLVISVQWVLRPQMDISETHQEKIFKKFTLNKDGSIIVIIIDLERRKKQTQVQAENTKANS
jgi:hypothetical protein